MGADENLTQKIRDDFDRLARYDQGGWDHNNHYHPFLLKQLPTRCQQALEIGCGTGAFARLLAQQAEQVLAIDLSPTMIEAARQRSSAFANIEFQVADILQWTIPAGHFDLIASIATLHHLPVETLLPTLSAALKPGGRLVVLDLLAHEGWRDTISDLLASPLHRLYAALKNRHQPLSPEAAAAWQAHGETDQYLTLTQARRIYASALPGATVRKHLFWRYSVVWEKPAL